MDVLSTISTRKTPQTSKADPRQIKNAAGGYTFAVDDWTRVHRFLTIGTTGGTYYTSAKDLTRDNADVILRAAATDPVELVKAIVDVSTRGKAPKQNPALFALAIAASCDNEAGRKAALDALPAVARTGTHLFLFAGYVEQFRGWGRGLRTAVGKWYSERPVDKLAYQVLKYRQREGWTHRDLLRLSHAGGTAAHAALYAYVCGRDSTDLELPELVDSFIAAQFATTPAGWLTALEDRNLSWEMLPDAALGHRGVWEALIHNGIPQTALMRQLPRLTRLGVLDGKVGSMVADQLKDPERLLKARVHPVNVLVALRTYASGVSARGTGSWTPNRKVTDALDAAFYASYGAVDPAGKRTLLALDVSGSMTASAGGLPVSCREVSAALAMVTAACEPEYGVVGFTAEGGRRGGYYGSRETALTELDISPRRRLDDNIRAVSGLPFGRTDCALPMAWATKNRVEVDSFFIFTDSETYWGGVHPHQALTEYRQKMGIDAKLAVVAMTASGNSIADPSDPGQIDVSGFDSTVPNLLADFSRGDL